MSAPSPATEPLTSAEALTVAAARVATMGPTGRDVAYRSGYLAGLARVEAMLISLAKDAQAALDRQGAAR